MMMMMLMMMLMIFSSQLQNVNSAITSVKTSSTNVKKVIEDRFEDTKNQVIAALDSRMIFLLTTVKDIERKDLEPLKNLKEELGGDVSTMKALIKEGT